MGKNRVRLSLFGTDYIITSDEEESYVRRIGDEVEKRITANMQQNTRISVLMAAVLTALDYCDEAKKANQSADNLRSQIKDYLEESAKARMEAGEARREIETMKREIQTLRMRLAEQDSPAGQTASQPMQQGGIPGRSVAAPSPISRPAAPMGHPVPPQARMYSKPVPVDDKADEEVLSFLEQDEPKE